mmetsp:Transcript_31166/g.90585  ORF Transcript_31166/g.90585 Transcript_31166/m.90585 type:complete len:249 (+) Transcript_31166:608-1354(+)
MRVGRAVPGVPISALPRAEVERLLLSPTYFRAREAGAAPARRRSGSKCPRGPRPSARSPPWPRLPARGAAVVVPRGPPPLESCSSRAQARPEGQAGVLRQGPGEPWTCGLQPGQPARRPQRVEISSLLPSPCGTARLPQTRLLAPLVATASQAGPGGAGGSPQRCEGPPAPRQTRGAPNHRGEHRRGSARHPSPSAGRQRGTLPGPGSSLPTSSRPGCGLGTGTPERKARRTSAGGHPGGSRDAAKRK